MGKTTLIKELWHRDMAVIPEISHELIKEQQAIGGDAFPWKNKKPSLWCKPFLFWEFMLSPATIRLDDIFIEAYQSARRHIAKSERQ